MSLLEVDDLRLTIPTASGDAEILRGVGLSVDAGETLALVGESGSGKSMTVRSILQLLPPHSRLTGSVRLDDRELVGADPAVLRGIRRDRVGMIFQNPRAHINPVRSIGDFLTEGLLLRGVGRRDARARAVEALDAVRVPHPEERLRAYPHELSGGMLQRVMIASVLLAEPALILADEPTTALDVTTQAEVLAILAALRRERDLAMLLITHDLDLAAAVCQRVAVMEAGRIVEAGPSDRILERPENPYTQRLVHDRPSLPDAEVRS